MKAVLQRVISSSGSVDGKCVGAIEQGLNILLGVGKEDSETDIQKLINKIVNLRIFEDDDGKMNRSLLDVGGSCLVISQFTLFADCKHGRRPSFFDAGQPDIANELYNKFCDVLSVAGVKSVQKGVFGADMKVNILNDGPVTILLDSKEL